MPMPRTAAAAMAAITPKAIAAGCVRHNDGDVRAEGIDRGVGDMQDAKQAVDEREADGHQRIHAAEDKPVERQVDVVHSLSRAGSRASLRRRDANSLRSSIQA